MTFFSIQKTSLFAGVLALCLMLMPVFVQAQSEDSVSSATESSRPNKSVKTNAPIVIELFTTSDCTACVFADRMLYDGLQDKNVIGLSCHINDMYALGGKTKASDGPMDPCVFRQWAYMSSHESDVSISTPSFVFNGDDKIDGNDNSYYQKLLEAYHYAGKNHVIESLMLWKDEDTLSIQLPQDPRYETEKRNASVWLIRYKDIVIEKIDDGMNKGRVLRFSNVIQDIKHVGKWHGATRTIDVDVSKAPGGKEAGGYVVLVSELMGDPILVAGKLKDYPVKTPASTTVPAQ